MNQAVAFALFCTVLCGCCTSYVACYWEDCESYLASLTNFSIVGCHETDSRCFLKHGQKTAVDVEFTSHENVTHVYARVFGRLLDNSDDYISFPIKNLNVCKDIHSGLRCPLMENQIYHYTTEIFMTAIDNESDMEIELELVDQYKVTIVCVSFAVTFTQVYKHSD